MNNELQQLGALIDRIYQGATEPNRWNDILPEVASWVGAPKGLLFTPLAVPEQGGFLFNYGNPPSELELWATRYQPHDIWANRIYEKGLALEGNVLLGDEHVPREELVESIFYKEFLSRQDTSCVVSGIVYGTDSPGNMPVTVCALFRRHRDALFSPAEQERLAILVPHLSRAVGVMLRLRDAELKVAATLAALDKLRVAVLLFDGQGRVTYANTATGRILDEDDGLYLKCGMDSPGHIGELHAHDNRESEKIARALRRNVSPDILATEHFSSAVPVTRPSGRTPYTLNFSALPANNEFGAGAFTPVTIAFINDDAEPVAVDEELLSRTYRLTPAEIRAIRLLLEGLSAKECARRIGISDNTLRNQLQNIYQKTGTNSRARLIKLLFTLTDASRPR